MRNGVFMVALMASMLLIPTVHAASDVDTAKLLQSTAGHSIFKALKQEL